MRIPFFRFVALAIVAIMAPVAFSSCVCVSSFDWDRSTYTSKFEESYPLNAGGTVTVKNVDGYVRVTSWDKNEIQATGTLKVRAKNEEEARKIAKEIQVIISHDNDSFTAEIRRKNKRMPVVCQIGWSWSVDVDLVVPRRCKLALSTVDGSISVTEVNGNHKLTTVDGSIVTARVKGDVSCRTTDGSCWLGELDGAADVGTVDGSIKVDGKLNGVKARAIDGTIRVTALEGSGNPTEWSLSTVDGSVILAVPESFSFDLKAATSDGHISIEGPAEYVSRSHHKVIARVGEGGGTISINTSSGSITVGSEE